MEKGVVIKSTGKWYKVQLADNSVMECRIVGKFRLNGLKLTNPVAVGDLVEVEPEGMEGQGLIKTISGRRNYIVRQSPSNKHYLHLIASNIDQAIIISTIVNPNLKPGFIDRVLLMTEPHNIPVCIVFNKADLYRERDFELYVEMEEIYEAIGYKVFLVSALEKKGMEELEDILKGKTTLLSGQSGVGKSTLLNSIQPHLNLSTEELSDYSGKGQHTTTFAEMHTLDFGGTIIDTPGIKSLSFNNLEPMDVSHNFREFFSLSPQCKFGDCTHRNEPHCAVKDAIEKGAVSELRYLSYVTILEEIEQQNYWERHRDM